MLMCKSLTYTHFLGASGSDVVQFTRTLHSPDGEVNVTQTKIAFIFHHPCVHSPYRPPIGSTLEETTLALLRGEWPFPYPIDSPRSTTPASPSRQRSPISITDSTPASPSRPRSPISISDTSSCICSPPAYVKDAASLDPALAEEFDFDKVTPNVRRDRRARKRAIPPADRWYAVTRGLRVGAVQGA